MWGPAASGWASTFRPAVRGSRPRPHTGQVPTATGAAGAAGVAAEAVNGDATPVGTPVTAAPRRRASRTTRPTPRPRPGPAAAAPPPRPPHPGPGRPARIRRVPAAPRRAGVPATTTRRPRAPATVSRPCRRRSRRGNPSGHRPCGDLDQYIGVARKVERAPAREVAPGQLGAGRLD